MTRESHPDPNLGNPIPPDQTEQVLLSPIAPSAHQTPTSTLALAAPYPQNEQPSHSRMSPEELSTFLTKLSATVDLVVDDMKGFQILGGPEELGTFLPELIAIVGLVADNVKGFQILGGH